MTPEWRLVMALWVISSLGIAGIVTAVTYKPHKEPIQTINRKGKSDALAKHVPQPPRKTIARGWDI